MVRTKNILLIPGKKVFGSQMLPFKTRIYMAYSNIVLIGLRKSNKVVKVYGIEKRGYKKVMYPVYIVIQELKSYK